MAARAGEAHPAIADDLATLAQLVGQERWSAEAALDPADVARVEELERSLVEALAERRPATAGR
ncbi:MAG: hypothetical protein R2702_00795 [Acidimicrobiales bacterium]